MLSKKDITEINKKFSTGKFMNESSIDYAVSITMRSKNWLKTSAIFTRSILIDQVFEDGNKRTAAAVIMMIMELNNIKFDAEEIPKIIVFLLKKNYTDVVKIERVMKNGIR